jgi:hypothetical protein
MLRHLAAIGGPAGGLGIDSWGGSRVHGDFSCGYM